MPESFAHQSVMPTEVVRYMKADEARIIVDGTVGGGGHAAALLAAAGPETRLIGIDLDKEALTAAKTRLAPYGERVILCRGNFADMPAILQKLNIDKVDGILLDLGVSSPQLDIKERGFSYQEDAFLDMRMDRSQEISAYTLINSIDRDELAYIIRHYGEERWAERIADFIAAERRKKSIETTGELVRIVKMAIPASARRRGPHPARRTFQALRIAVNQELDNLRCALNNAVDLLNGGGRLVVISFHSLEDRIVKNFINHEAHPCTCPPELAVCVCGKKPRLKPLMRRCITPTAEEKNHNPRARSAKLRAAERVLQTEVNA